MDCIKKKSNAPILWRKYGVGYRIENLTENHYEEALNLLKNCYLTNDYVCDSFKIHSDQESLESFLNRALFHMKANNSLIMIDERIKYKPDDDDVDIVKCYVKDSVIGVLILRIVDKINFPRLLSRICMLNGQAHKDFVRFKQELIKSIDEFVLMNCDSFMRIYYVCISPKFRRKDFTLKLLNAALDSARRLNIQVISGQFNSRKLQYLAKTIGMNIVKEIKYDDWNLLRNEEIFKKNSHELKCAFMIGFIEQEPLPEIDVKEDDEDGKKKKGKKKKDKKKKDKKKKKK